MDQNFGRYSIILRIYLQEQLLFCEFHLCSKLDIAKPIKIRL